MRVPSEHRILLWNDRDSGISEKRGEDADTVIRESGRISFRYDRLPTMHAHRLSGLGGIIITTANAENIGPNNDRSFPGLRKRRREASELAKFLDLAVDLSIPTAVVTESLTKLDLPEQVSSYSVHPKIGESHKSSFVQMWVSNWLEATLALPKLQLLPTSQQPLGADLTPKIPAPNTDEPIARLVA